MTHNNTYMGIYRSFAEVEVAIRKLQDAGFTTKCLSVIGRDDGADKNTAACYNTGGGIEYDERFNDSWTRIRTLLSSWGFFWSFKGGLLHVGGLLVLAMAKAQKDNKDTEDSVFGTALSGIGIPADSIAQYEKVLQNNQLLLCAQGTLEEINFANAIFIETQPLNGTLHHEGDE